MHARHARIDAINESPRQHHLLANMSCSWPRLPLLLVVAALLSPACLAGVIAKEDGGGVESVTPPFEIGDTAMTVQGTSFVSSVDSNHVRVPTPEVATAGSLFIMLIGDSGGVNDERAQYRDHWTPLVDIGEDELNLKVQYKTYGGGSDHFGIQGGVNQFVTMPSIANVDATNPIVDVVAERFVTNSSSWEVASPSVNSVPGGAVLVLYLLDSVSSRDGDVVVSAISSHVGFEVLGSNVAMSGENMAVFISPSEEGGGCTGPIVADLSGNFSNEGVISSPATASGIVVAITLRPQGGLVSDLLIPCSENAIWDETRILEREGLIQIYEETGGGDWTRSGGWLEEGVDHCDFEGVDCNHFGLVTRLNLERNNLDGALPRLDTKFRFLQYLNLNSNAALEGSFDDLGAQNLANITHIDLSRTKLTGGLGKLPETLLYLDLSDNLLGPEAPNVTQGTNCTLETLDLSANGFEALNVSLLTSLTTLDISRNKKLKYSIANLGIGNLPNLKKLVLANSPLTGDLKIGHMQNLQHLNIKSVGLGGLVDDTGIMNIPNLTHIDLGGSSFTGEFNFCNYTYLNYVNLNGNDLFANLTDLDCNLLTHFEYIDLGGCNYTGKLQTIGNLQQLRFMDISRNLFYGPLPTDGVLGFIQHLDISMNSFSGTLPNFVAPALTHLDCSYNLFTGTVPPSIGELSVLSYLDLSNQLTSVYNTATGERETSGLTGQIPESVGQLRFLQTLLLGTNQLSGSIPSSISTLSYLETVDIEDNNIGSRIPPSLNILEQLDRVLLARNQLSGPIPDLSGSREKVRTVTLSGNPDLDAPAPFILCDLEDLDLRSNNKYCPAERSALAAFYTDLKGAEWLNRTGWLTNAHHCTWSGVTCSEDRKKVLGLNLGTNGVTGQIPEEFFRKLKDLEVLDLNENDIRGEISSEIKHMKNLRYLRLSYNRFTALPSEMAELKNLSHVFIQGNRLSGDDKHVTVHNRQDEGYQFISDCGSPTDAAEPFVCSECDMCCNSLEECQEPLVPQLDGYSAAGVIVAAVFGALVTVWIILRHLAKRGKVRSSTSSAIKAAGDDSVYSFVLTKSKSGWLIVLLTVFIQVLVFGLFLQASDFSNDDGDFVYSFRCPRNTDECNDERAVTTYGWFVWIFLVFSSLLDDLANGVKLLILSATRGSTQCFISGLTIFCIATLAIYTSFTYNRAIAITNTELVINAVVLLFVNEVDSQVFSIAYIFNSKWLHEVVDEAEEYSDALLQQDVVDDSVLEAARDAKTEAGSERLSGVANSLRASSQDLSKASSTSSKRRLGASSIQSRSTKSSSGESHQKELLLKFEFLQRQMSELRAEITAESPSRTLDSIANQGVEEADQNEPEEETPHQQSSCAVQ